MTYADFLANKLRADKPSGLRADQIPPLSRYLKPHQKAPTEWALKRGRAALFLDTGLGKTLAQLEWARVVSDWECKPVLGLTPLAVAEQTVQEARKFGIEGVAYASNGFGEIAPITITNYDRVHLFDPSMFAGVFLDESSIIKSHSSQTRIQLIEMFRDTPWKLCCSATPAPNDYTELGNHSEFLNVMTEKEMLSMFFVHDGKVRAEGTQGKDGWRLKRHAEQEFWRWLASWAVVIRSPADLGFDEPGYELPPLIHHQITVPAEYAPTGGFLFPMEAHTMSERLSVRRESIDDRIAASAKIVCKGIIRSVLSAPCYQTPPKNVVASPPANGMPPIPIGERLIRERHLPADNQKQEEPTKERTTKQTKINGLDEPRASATNITQQDAQNMLLIQNIEKGQSDNQEFLRHAEGQVDSEYLRKNITISEISRAVPAQYVKDQTEILSAGPSMSIIATKRELSEDCFAQTAILASENLKTILTFSKELSNTFWKEESRWIIWCQLNKEQDELEKLFGDLCFSIYGTLRNDEKIDRCKRWLRGDRPILITKVLIFGYGMNFQSCSNMLFVGLNDSFEQLYQAKRRCWRYGQVNPVHVYMIASELEGAVVSNVERKEREFEVMQAQMAQHMRALVQAEVLGGRRATEGYRPKMAMEIPTWM